MRTRALLVVLLGTGCGGKDIDSAVEAALPDLPTASCTDRYDWRPLDGMGRVVAWEEAEEYALDVSQVQALMGIKFIKLSGWEDEFQGEIDELRAMPVLMLTARGQSRDRDMAEKAGVSRFMTKPFSNAEVLTAVRDLHAQATQS